MKYILIGKIVNTHGIRGEVRIVSNFKYKNKVFIKDTPIYIGKEKNKEIINTYRHHKQYEMITMMGYTNINEILKYKGRLVYVNSDDLKLDKDCYLDEDLINLDVYLEDVYIGKVIRIDKYPANDIIVVRNDKKSYLIPYVSDIIEVIDINEKKIVVKNIKGLIE